MTESGSSPRKSITNSLWKKRLLLLVSGAAMVFSALLWTRGLLDSPLINPEMVIEKHHLAAHAADSRQERLLAEGYWLRYSDVREDRSWGKSGTMGIWGPRDHYRQHGKREGRIHQPVKKAKDWVQERDLARAYWQRYPDIRISSIWGEASDLGIFGPRDYHDHIGRHQGRVWGQDDHPQQEDPER